MPRHLEYVPPADVATNMSEIYQIHLQCLVVRKPNGEARRDQRALTERAENKEK
jgi:hypothetical protein